MRQLTYLVATSLDGRIAAPDGDVTAFPTDGDHVDALVRQHPDTIPAFAHAALGARATGAEFDTVLMGWSTYAAGFAVTRDPYPHARQVVFSRRRAPDDAAPGVEVTAEDPVAVVRRLKQEPGTGIWLCGGGRLAGALADEADRLVLKINPVLLGDGVPLLAGPATTRRFVHETTTTHDSGVVVATYRRDRVG